MSIKIVEISGAAEWESDLCNSSYSVFITPQWLEALDTPARIPIYLNFVIDDNTVGKLAGLRIESTNPRKRLLFFYGLPSVPATNESLLPHLLDELVLYSTANKYNRLIVRAYDSPIELMTGNREFKLAHQDEYIVDLTGSIDEIRKRFRKKSIMSNVKTAIKNGAVFLETQSPEVLDQLVLLLEETKTMRLSKGYADYSYYSLPYLDKDVLYRTLANGAATLFCVKIQDSMSCIDFVLTHRRKAYGLLIGTDSKGYKLGIPAFLKYSLIAKLKELGFESHNLAGVPSDSSASGLEYFKTSLGAKRFPRIGGSTNYLQFPYKLLNPLLDIGRRLPDSFRQRIMSKFL